MAKYKYLFIRAQILNPHSDTKCDFLTDGLLVARYEGKKASIIELLPYHKGAVKYLTEMQDAKLVEKRDHLLLPAFFDMHFHWVQDDVRLMPKDSLLTWLDKYTFPTEARFAKKSYAQSRAKRFFKRLVSVGTLGGACYSSVHEHALDYAMKEAKGDLLIGNVLMTMNSPKNLAQKTNEATALANKLMDKYKHRYVLTPRFAIATHPEVMKMAGKKADRLGVFKQSHLSETKGEIDFVLSLYRKEFPPFKKVKNYTEIYQRCHMLGKRSLMGHAIHLSEAELALIKKTQTKLIHCPTSNAPIKESGLGSGLFDFNKVEKKGIDWALGSDIGGGPFLSMLDVMHSFVRQHNRVGRKQATYIKALYRSTLAGAKILGVDKRTGNLKSGKEANFILLKAPKGKYDDAESCLKALLKGAHQKRTKLDSWVKATYYRGERLFKD